MLSDYKPIEEMSREELEKFAEKMESALCLSPTPNTDEMDEYETWWDDVIKIWDWQAGLLGH